MLGFRLSFTKVLLMFLLILGPKAASQEDVPAAKEYTVGKGRHFSSPRVYKLRRNPEVIRWNIRFADNCNYIIREADGKISVDQLDWNKLCGIFFKVLSFNTRKESVMMGWRYNIEEDEIELAPYYHINAGRDMFPPMMTVRREEVFQLELHINHDKKTYRWIMQKDGFIAEHEMPFEHTSRTCGLINFYFGGNRSAPQEVSCNIGLAFGNR